MKVGIYAGSFNPWHLGYYNILQKAEKIFDRVIIVRACNPLKKNELISLPKILVTRPIMEHDGLLTDLIKSLPFDNITLIRGLRNSIDLQHEINQYNVINGYQIITPQFLLKKKSIYTILFPL